MGYGAGCIAWVCRARAESLVTSYCRNRLPVIPTAACGSPFRPGGIVPIPIKNAAGAWHLLR